MKIDKNTDTIQNIINEAHNSIHDLKTPLQAIILHTTSILDGDNNTLSDIIEDVEGIHEVANKLFIKIDQALNNVQFIYESSNLNMELENILKPIETAVNYVYPNVAQKNLEIINKVPADLEAIKIDVRKIESVFSNLLSNAVKHTPEHGKILIDCHIYNEKLQLIVADNGPGISVDDKEKIFEIFNTGKEKINEIESSGIGLYIAQNYVSMHKGTLDLNSPLDKEKFRKLNLSDERVGTGFYVTIPYSS